MKISTYQHHAPFCVTLHVLIIDWWEGITVKDFRIPATQSQAGLCIFRHGEMDKHIGQTHTSNLGYFSGQKPCLIDSQANGDQTELLAAPPFHTWKDAERWRNMTA